MVDDRMTSVAEVLPVVSPSLVRRKRNCKVCKSTSAIEDVNARIVDEHGQRRVGYVRSVSDYLRGIGVVVGHRAIEGHAKHVLEDLANPPRRVLPDRAVALAPAGVPASWLDVHDQGINLGMEALRDLRARLPDLQDKDLIAVARLGLSAAGKQADIEARGRALSTTVSALAALASGHSGEVEARVDHLTVRARIGEGRGGVEVEDRRGGDA